MIVVLESKKTVFGTRWEVGRKYNVGERFKKNIREETEKKDLGKET